MWEEKRTQMVIWTFVQPFLLYHITPFSPKIDLYKDFHTTIQWLESHAGGPSGVIFHFRQLF